MPLKKSVGNMYPWVTHTHCHLGGECPHKCVYCYVDNPRWGRPPRYQGKLRVVDQELKVRYGTDKTIFIECMNDLFCKEMPEDYLLAVFLHCKQWPANTYVFQTKNPARYEEFLTRMPSGSIIGTTIETNRVIEDIGEAPDPEDRAQAMWSLPTETRKFVTIEPVLDFDVDVLAEWIYLIQPEFLNLGADSKNHHLPEPTVEKIHQLVAKLAELGIELREKHNLSRLMKS